MAAALSRVYAGLCRRDRLTSKKCPFWFYSLFCAKVQQFGHYFANVARDLKSKAFPLANFAWRHNNNTQALRTNEIFKFSFVSTISVEV